LLTSEGSALPSLRDRILSGSVNWLKAPKSLWANTTDDHRMCHHKEVQGDALTKIYSRSVVLQLRPALFPGRKPLQWLGRCAGVEYHSWPLRSASAGDAKFVQHRLGSMCLLHCDSWRGIRPKRVLQMVCRQLPTASPTTGRGRRRKWEWASPPRSCGRVTRSRRVATMLRTPSRLNAANRLRSRLWAN